MQATLYIANPATNLLLFLSNTGLSCLAGGHWVPSLADPARAGKQALWTGHLCACTVVALPLVCNRYLT